MDSQFDALPYFDKEIEIPGLKDAALAEIESELKNTPQISSTDPRLGPSIDLFSKSPNLHALLASSSSGKPIKALDPSIYRVPELSTNENSEEEWEEAVKRSKVMLAHLEVRQQNLSLLSSYAPNAHLIRNYQLENTALELEREVEVWKEKVVEVNRGRRVYQESTGLHLTTLESRWQDLVTSSVQTEMANTALGGEVEALRRREAELREEVEAMGVQV